MNTHSKPDENHVLAVALMNLKEHLELSYEDLGHIIGLHRNSITRLLKREGLTLQVKKGSFHYY